MMEGNNGAMNLQMAIQEYIARRYRHSADPDLLEPNAIAKRLSQGVRPAQIWLASDPADDEDALDGAADFIVDMDSDDGADAAEFAAAAGLKAEYVLVDRVDEEDPRLVWVIPLINNECIQDRTALVIDQTPLGVAMAAWPHFRIRIPVHVLDVPLKSLPISMSQMIIANRENPDMGVVRGQDPQDARNKRIVDRHVRDMLETFLVWSLACRQLPPLHVAGSSGLKRTPSRGELLRQVAQALGVNPVEAGQLIEGTAKPTEAQRAALQAAGVSLESAAGRELTLPADLLVEVEQPAWRQAILYYAETHGIQILPARMALAQDAFELAARPSGHGREAWRGALAQVVAGLE
ncbi:hypothetical protein [Bifidobacterium ruminantium]|uniref:hypothetical protein n=1 Tax=Bifidobacterium ruminantium TaxID=78346 RepID=UPI001C21542A|nr:hypothetical protein [Bifidobacterium ruminantium]MBU9112373.1 hypothetical protein [Bifidobacterium ruminantium]